MTDGASVVPSLFQGRIVYVRSPILDPQGRNAKANRPFVVLTPADSIADSDDLLLIAISHEQGRAGQHVVPLPWANPGVRCSTTFTSPGFAICNWAIKHPKSDLDIDQGFVPPKTLLVIASKYIEWRDSSNIAAE